MHDWGATDQNNGKNNTEFEQRKLILKFYWKNENISEMQRQLRMAFQWGAPLFSRKAWGRSNSIGLFLTFVHSIVIYETLLCNNCVIILYYNEYWC